MQPPDQPSSTGARSAAFFARAAAAVADHPAVVSFLIARYRAYHALTDDDLAAWLGLAGTADLHQLALCTRPLPSTPSFDADVVELACYFGGNVGRFRELLLARVDRYRPLH